MESANDSDPISGANAYDFRMEIDFQLTQSIGVGLDVLQKFTGIEDQCIYGNESRDRLGLTMPPVRDLEHRVVARLSAVLSLVMMTLLISRGCERVSPSSSGWRREHAPTVC